MKSGAAAAMMLVALAGCSQGQEAPPPAARPDDYLQVRLVGEGAGFNSRLYKMPGENRNVALEDSTLLDLSAVAGADVRSEERPDQFTVKLFFTPAGKERSRAILPRFEDRRVGILVDGRLVGVPLAIEVSWEDSVTVIQHLAQEDAWGLASGINEKVQLRKVQQP